MRRKLVVIDEDQMTGTERGTAARMVENGAAAGRRAGEGEMITKCREIVRIESI
jgi:hypothetical protein